MPRLRQGLGENFSEGARLLWLELERGRLTYQGLRARLGLPAADVVRWLYGDRRPSLRSASELERVFGIPVAAWHQRSRRTFTPPGKRKAA